MDTIEPWRFVFSFLFVIGLIGVFALLMKRYDGNKLSLFKRPLFNAQEAGARLQIVEIRYIDPKHKLVLIRRDTVEHLILIADGRELIIESGIVSGTLAP